MDMVFETLKDNPLFQGIAHSDFELMLNCLSARKASYHKDDILLLSGDTVNFVGLILSGSVRAINEDVNGNVALLAEFGVSEVFGEVFACAGIDHSPITILAAEDTEVLYIDYKRVISSCSSACPFHIRLIENMLQLIAKRNLMLNQKIDILSKHTTREKLLCFFDIQRGSLKKFTIPFNREQLARYLCVDRSAMSNELCKMRNEGLIRFDKNRFELLT